MDEESATILTYFCAKTLISAVGVEKRERNLDGLKIMLKLFNLLILSQVFVS